MGSFFFGYVLTELPGGRMAEIIGARRVFGYSMLASALITFITPTAARAGYIAVVVTRAVLGFMLASISFIISTLYYTLYKGRFLRSSTSDY